MVPEGSLPITVVLIPAPVETLAVDPTRDMANASLAADNDIPTNKIIAYRFMTEYLFPIHYSLRGVADIGIIRAL